MSPHKEDYKQGEYWDQGRLRTLKPNETKRQNFTFYNSKINTFPKVRLEYNFEDDKGNKDTDSMYIEEIM